MPGHPRSIVPPVVSCPRHCKPLWKGLFNRAAVPPLRCCQNCQFSPRCHLAERARAVNSVNAECRVPNVFHLANPELGPVGKLAAHPFASAGVLMQRREGQSYQGVDVFLSGINCGGCHKAILTPSAERVRDFDNCESQRAFDQRAPQVVVLPSGRISLSRSARVTAESTWTFHAPSLRLTQPSCKHPLTADAQRSAALSVSLRSADSPRE
jgi:hypothetical protein